MIHVGVLGSTGRMGREVLRVLKEEFSAHAEIAAQPKHGEDLSVLNSCDVIIDFALPEAVMSFIKQASGNFPTLIVCSTGWTLDQRKELEVYSKKAPVLMSSNFSLGFQAVLEILKTAGPLLDKLGYSPVIVETHHKYKKDAPSGTAISLQRAASPLAPGNVQIQSVRAGEVIGDHEITFYGAGDHITLGHFAQDRSIFARGAIQCATWLAGKRSQITGFVPIENYLKDYLK